MRPRKPCSMRPPCVRRCIAVTYVTRQIYLTSAQTAARRPRPARRTARRPRSAAQQLIAGDHQLHRAPRARRHHDATVAREAGLSQGIVNLHFREQGEAADGDAALHRRRIPHAWRAPPRRAPGAPADRAGTRWSISTSAAASATAASSRCGSRSGASAKSRPTYRQICADARPRHTTSCASAVHDARASRATTATSIRTSSPTAFGADRRAVARPAGAPGGDEPRAGARDHVVLPRRSVSASFQQPAADARE